MGVSGVQDRERAWHQQRRSDTLYRARQVQRQRARRHGAGQRSKREQGKARQEDAARAETVAQHAGRQQEDGKAEGVRIDYPLQSADAGAQFAADFRQGNVDDGDVKLDDDEGKAGG